MSNGPQRLEPPETWKQPIADFLEFKKAGGCSELTRRTRYMQLRRFAELVAVAPEEVSLQQLTQALADAKSQETRHNLKNCFSTFFAWLQASGTRSDNPAALLPSVRASRPHPTPCPDDYITKAFANATGDEHTMLRLASECGLRRAEIAQVQSDDVLHDVHGFYSLIVHGKGDKQRIIPLPTELAAIIESAGGYVFKGRFGSHVEASYISKHIGRLLPKGYSVHKLRHRFATTAYGQSHDMLAVSKALGHSSTEVTQRYVALPDEALRELVKAATIEPEHSKTLPARTQSRKPVAKPKRVQQESLPVRQAIIVLLVNLEEYMNDTNTRSFTIHLTEFASNPFIVVRDAERVPNVLKAVEVLEAMNIIETTRIDNDTIGGNLTTSSQKVQTTRKQYSRTMR